MAVTTTNLGVITAYGDAVAAGYTGTKAEWQALMASYATVAEDANDAKDAAVAAKNTAVAKATEATTAASTATTKASEASASAQSIAQSAAQIQENTDDIDQLKSDLEPLIKYSNFQVGANATHSALLNRLVIDIPYESVFHVVLTGLDGRLAEAFAYTDESNHYYSLGSIKEGVHKFTATQNIVKIGIFITSGSSAANIHLGAFRDTDILGKSLKSAAYNIDALSSHFSVSANATHSVLLDRVDVDINSGDKFFLLVTGLNGRLGQAIAYKTDTSQYYTVGTPQDGTITEYTATQDIKSIGLFVTSGTATANVSFIVFKASSLLGKFAEMPNEYNRLNIDATSAHFNVPANTTHSTTKDKAEVNIKKGENFCVLLNGLGTDRLSQAYAYYSDSYYSLGRIANGEITEFTATEDINSIGLYITSGTATADISLIVFKTDSLLGNLYKIPVDGYNDQYAVKLANAKRKANAGAYTALTSPEILTIAHFSDIHASAWAMKEIEKFRNVFADSLNDTICTGDMVHDKFSDGMAFWNDNSDGSILTCIGNHDSYNGTDFSTPVSQTDLYNTFIAPYKDNWGAETVANHTYWYKDYQAQKVRLIVIDATIFDATEQSAQITWLNNALSGALSSGYSVVGAVHFPPMPNTFQKIDGNFSALLHGTADDMWQFAWNTYNTAILGAVDDFINDGGDFVCWLSGHTHHDIISYDSRYPKQLFVTITCAMPNAEGEERERNINDGTGLALNTVCVDTVRKYVKLIRYGAEWDDCLRHTGTCVIKYDSSPATVMFYN